MNEDRSPETVSERRRRQGENRTGHDIGTRVAQAEIPGATSTVASATPLVTPDGRPARCRMKTKTDS